MSKSKGFWSSSHKLLYLILSIRYRVWPSRVYNLAHGLIKDDYTTRDESIIEALLRKRVIHQL